MDRTRAVIGADAKFAGTISNVKSIEIEGTVEADLTAEKLSIGATGKFTGQVSCDLVVIGGAYDGIMQAGSICAVSVAQMLPACMIPSYAPPMTTRSHDT